MKRTELSEAVLDGVVRRHQKGLSWLGIEKETGIPRRIAKREYGRWEATQARHELETVRRDVAAEEFRGHLGMMREMAVEVSSLVTVPAAFDNLKARKLIDAGVRAATERRAIDQDVTALARLSPRQRWWLYEALRAHTRESVPWNRLDEWMRQWDRAIEIKDGISAQMDAFEVNPHLANWAEGRITELRRPLWILLWSRLLQGNADPPSAEDIAAVVAEVTPSGHDQHGAQELASAFKSHIDIVMLEDNPQHLEVALRLMRECARQLDEALDPIRLTPGLLRTRCGLCSA